MDQASVDLCSGRFGHVRNRGPVDRPQQRPIGNPQIASGTEATVLSIRMLMTEQPLLGQIYVTAPPTLRELVIGPLTGYTEDDLTPGGRLAAPFPER